MTDPKLIADQQARERICTCLDKNFLVEASAGSGKTTQLVERMTALVKSGVPVGSICAITFTNAAAREFYKRFQKSLIKESRDCPDETQRRRCAQALNNIDLCFMDTIDAFTQTLLREHPAEAGLPSDFRICSKEELKGIWAQEYSAILRGEYGEELRDKALELGRWFDKPERIFVSHMEDIMTHRDSTIHYSKPYSGDLYQRLRPAMDKADRLYQFFLDNSDLDTDTSFIANDKPSRKLLGDLTDKKRFLTDPSASYDNILGALETLDGFVSRLSPEELNDLYRQQQGDPALEDIADPRIFSQKGSRKIVWVLEVRKKMGLYKVLSESKYRAAMDLLCSAAEPVARACRSRGELDFYDCLLYLRDMLRQDAGEGGSLIRHIYSRRSCFLIDEFQDTDPLQAQIFFYLTAREPVEDWTRCKPRPGSLFIVGDPKQSIYRFKSADVGSYMIVRGLFEQTGPDSIGEVLTLSRNFRSSGDLCGYFNTRFTQLMPEDTPDQCAYPPIPLEEKEPYQGTFGGVWSYGCAGPQNYSLPKDEKRLGDLVTWLVKSGQTVEVGGQVKPLTYGDIMIITPTKTSLPRIMEEMERRQVPLTVEGRTVFTQCPALVTLGAVMGAVTSPGDARLVCRALISPAYGLEERDLIALRNKGLYLSIYQEKDALEKLPLRTRRALNSLSELSLLTLSSSPAQLAEIIIDRLRLLELTGSRDLEYLYFALELLRSAQDQGQVLSCADGARFIDSLLEGGDKERCISLSPSSESILLANLHKVKGLERPVVILASPFRKKFPPTVRTVSRGMSSDHYVFSTDDLVTDSFPQEYALEENAGAAEELRLLYVAATRAASALIISESLLTDGSPAGQNPWTRLMIQGIRSIPDSAWKQGAPPDPAMVSAGELYEEARTQLALNDTSVKEPRYTLVRPSKLQLKKVPPNDPENDEPSPRDDKPQKPRLPSGGAAFLGTLVHKLMEVLISSKGKADPEKTISEILTDAQCQEPVYRQCLERVAEQLKNGGYPQENGGPADLLAELRDADQTMCEVPFCYREGRELRHGIMDLIYCKAGKWYIVDHKTNGEGGGLDEKYENQLEAYKAAFRSLTGMEAEARIYHIDV